MKTKIRYTPTPDNPPQSRLKTDKKKKKSGGGGGCLGRKERNREMTIKIQNPIDFRQCDRDTHALSHREKIKMSLEQSSSKSKTQV